MGDVSRRAALAAGLGLGAGALLGGCAPRPGSADDVVRLSYWSWLANLQTVCDIWNEQRPDVQVDAVWMQPGPDGGYQRIFSSLAAGGGPDLAQVEIRQASGFMLEGGLVDLTQHGLEQSVTERYEEAILGQLVFGDGLYALPQDWGPTAFYYRTDLLEEVGASAPPETWQEWAELAREFRAADKFLESYSIADGSFFCALAMQAGARWFRAEDDTWVIDTADDATLEVADFFDQAIDEGLVHTGYDQFSPGWYAAVNNDQIGAATSASWGDALIESARATEGLWNVAPMPRWQDGYGSGQLGGSTVSVISTTEHPREATEFAIWLTTDPEAIDAQIEHSGIGWSPVTDHIGTPREQPSEFFGGQSYNEEVFAPAAEDQNPDWSWIPTTQQAFDTLGDRFRSKLTGGASMVESCREVQGDIVAMLQHKGLNARGA